MVLEQEYKYKKKICILTELHQLIHHTKLRP
jgi:hypothetical protein